MHRYTEGGVEDTLSLLMEHVWQIWAQMCRVYGTGVLKCLNRVHFPTLCADGELVLQRISGRRC